MLTVLPPSSVEEEPLRTLVVNWRHYLGRVLLTVVAAMHTWLALTLLLAPDSQLFTQGTSPMFALAAPAKWAVGFAVGGAAAWMLLLRSTTTRLWITWLTVLPVQVMWLGAAVLAVVFGSGGSATSVVFLSAIVAFTAITTITVWSEHTSRKR